MKGVMRKKLYLYPAIIVRKDNNRLNLLACLVGLLTVY